MVVEDKLSLDCKDPYVKSQSIIPKYLFLGQLLHQNRLGTYLKIQFPSPAKTPN